MGAQAPAASPRSSAPRGSLCCGAAERALTRSRAHRARPRTRPSPCPAPEGGMAMARCRWALCALHANIYAPAPLQPPAHAQAAAPLPRRPCHPPAPRRPQAPRAFAGAGAAGTMGDVEARLSRVIYALNARLQPRGACLTQVWMPRRASDGGTVLSAQVRPWVAARARDTSCTPPPRPARAASLRWGRSAPRRLPTPTRPPEARPLAIH